MKRIYDNQKITLMSILKLFMVTLKLYKEKMLPMSNK